jgi:hypothetical protein
MALKKDEKEKVIKSVKTHEADTALRKFRLRFLVKISKA